MARTLHRLTVAILAGCVVVCASPAARASPDPASPPIAASAPRIRPDASRDGSPTERGLP